MVNSKKIGKSTVAVILLSILLTLSLILTATGAWFTNSKDSTAGDTVKFGKVEITSATATVTVESATKYLPGDTISGSVTFANGSDVDIYYIYDVTAKAYEDDTKSKELGSKLLTITSTSSSTSATELKVGASTPTQAVSFAWANTEEDNTLNGKTAYIEVTITVYAVQAKNMTAQTALEALNAMKAA